MPTDITLTLTDAETAAVTEELAQPNPLTATKTVDAWVQERVQLELERLARESAHRLVTKLVAVDASTRAAVTATVDAALASQINPAIKP